MIGVLEIQIFVIFPCGTGCLFSVEITCEIAMFTFCIALAGAKQFCTSRFDRCVLPIRYDAGNASLRQFFYCPVCDLGQRGRTPSSPPLPFTFPGFSNPQKSISGVSKSKRAIPKSPHRVFNQRVFEKICNVAGVDRNPLWDPGSGSRPRISLCGIR